MDKAKSKKLSNVEIIDRCLFLADVFVLTPYKEIYNGLRTAILPLWGCLGVSTVFLIATIVDIDLHFLNRIGLLFFYPHNYFLQKIYIVLCAISSFYYWGLFQSLLQLKLRRQLTKTFSDAGLKTFTGRLPAFVFDTAIDEETRRMRLKRNGSDISQFKAAQQKIEGDLSIYIDEVVENRTHGTVDLIYSQFELTKKYDMPSIDSLKPNSFVVGKGRAKNINCTLEDYPHLLVAGQTGGGKSTFLRQFITSLYLKNPSYKFLLIDPKLTEFHVFKNLPRVKISTNVNQGIKSLQNYSQTILEQRKEFISLNGCVDFDEVLRIPEGNRKYPEKFPKEKHRSKHIIVIDEAISLFMAGVITPEVAKSAKQAANVIASQGRALGIHIVLATQRPDRFAIDPQIKANLVGKLCYKVPNNASSMTILDSKKAADICGVKGRAIWQGTDGTFSVQTPNITKEEAEKLLANFYTLKPKQAEEEEPKENTNNLTKKSWKQKDKK